MEIYQDSSALAPEDIVSMLRDGDANIAMSHIVRQYGHLIDGIIRRRGVEKFHDVEDVRQEALILIFMKASQLRHPEKLISWISSIATRTSINWLLRRAAKNMTAPLIDTGTPGDATVDDVLRTEDQHLLTVAMGRLSEADRDLLTAAYFQRMSIRDIALRGEHNIPEGTVKRRLYTARQRLRRVLEEGPQATAR